MKNSGVAGRRSILPLLLAASSILAACGGGGGAGSPAAGGPPPTLPPPPPTTTTATGKLVDDPSGSPLGGIPVGLAPWVAGATPMPEGTTAPDGSFSFTAPNGHYLLYIGSNSPSDTMRPTIHDNITLTGGAQALKAPTLPPIPSITPPPSETNGNYRLMTIDQTYELPCFTEFNNQRSTRSLPLAVVDEWLTENSREANAFRASGNYVPGQPWPNNAYGALTTGNVVNGGGTSCATAMIDPQFVSSTTSAFNYAAVNDPRMTWFAGTWIPYGAPSNKSSTTGISEFPIDPRALVDPNVPTWP